MHLSKTKHGIRVDVYLSLHSTDWLLCHVAKSSSCSTAMVPDYVASSNGLKEYLSTCYCSFAGLALCQVAL